MMSSNHNSLMGLPPNSSGSHGMLNNNSMGMPPGLSPMLPSSSLNPAMNDSPLEFNTNKNRPPVAISSPNNNNAEISIIDETIVIEDTKRDRSSLRSGRARSREKDRERNRGKDRLRERNSRERERARSNDRARKENDLMRTNSRPNMNPDNHNSPSNGDGMPQPPSMPDPPPPPPGQSGGFGPINPWAPMWGPMGNPMGPMPPPMGGPMPGPVGPMGPIGPMGPMGPMGGPMGPPPNEPPPLTGDFRISWGMFGWVMSPEGSTVPVKNSLHCKTCVLIPPNQRALPPTTRDRPSGCRTVFVGGLPENVSEEVVRDVFERAGEITTIRLSKKNFCHIRYELEDFVDNAIFLSGYRMRINNSSESANSGRLHVDYAQARDDQYEFECRQRQLQREQRHRERMEAERLRPPSPPPVVHFSEHESSAISEQLKGEETFSRAAQILITWLERGDCTKRNAGIIYSMIQSTNSHVRRLMSEKEQYEEELEKFKEQTRARIQGVLMQFGQIERVFASAGHQKVWDHFTKAQRRNIEIWKKQAEEIKSVQLDESDRDDTEEMDVSDDDESNVGFSSFGKKKKTIQDSLKEENDSLRCQMEAYKNEVDLVKADLRSEMSVKDDQIQALKKTLQGMQQTLTDNAAKKRQDETKYGELKQKMKLAMDKYGFSEEDSSLDDVTTPPTSLVSEKSALLIGLISTFLHIHPKGASVDYIWSYIQQFEKEIRPSDIESLLNQYATVFKQISTGVGACLERKWTFIGFKQD